ncbi:MAG: hypothetical protein KDC87_06460, partial [Planctomycetes bacterium]|nr:hypothetical protein [Planctomycetota bacterium]
LGSAAHWVARCPDARQARGLASGAVGAALGVLAVVSLVLHGSVDGSEVLLWGRRVQLAGRGWEASAPTVDLLVAALAVGLAPVASHGPRTLAAILRLIALALAFLGMSEPLGLAALWGLQFVVAAGELRRLDEAHGGSAAKPFVRYQAPALGLVVLGTLALLFGFRSLGVTAWLMAIAVREAVIPFHGWLPTLIARAPLGLVIALVAPQPGVYAHLAVFGDMTGGALAHGFAAVGAFTGVLGAALGVVQNDARRAAGWLIVSQTGLIAFGLANESQVGRLGAVLSWQVMALAMSGYTMTIAALEARRGTLSLRVPGGSFARTPRMAVAFLLLGFSSVALPLTLGFVAEDLLVQGSVAEFPHVGFAVILATGLNGINVVRCFFVLFSGTERHTGEVDLTRREVWALSLVLGALLLGGVFPRLFVAGGPSPPGTAVHGHPGSPSEVTDR